jgi:hypothetical protein
MASYLRIKRYREVRALRQNERGRAAGANPLRIAAVLMNSLQLLRDFLVFLKIASFLKTAVSQAQHQPSQLPKRPPACTLGPRYSSTGSTSRTFVTSEASSEGTNFLLQREADSQEGRRRIRTQESTVLFDIAMTK